MDNVVLRKFEEKDILNKIRWVNDDDNNEFLHYDLPLNFHSTKQWYEKNKNNETRYDAVIEVNGQPAGIIGLLSIIDKKAEYYILIGESEYKGKGVAKKATLLLYDIAFNIYGLEEVITNTEVDNIAMQRLVESVGGKYIRREKDSAKNRGKYVDRYVYCTTEEVMKDRNE